MIVLDRPLQVKVEDKVRFAQDRKLIRLLDSNGQERKGALVEIVSVAGGRR